MEQIPESNLPEGVMKSDILCPWYCSNISAWTLTYMKRSRYEIVYLEVNSKFYALCY